MSTPEEPGPLERGSKVKVSRNAKGDPQWEVSVHEGSPQEELDRLRNLAVHTYRELEREFTAQ